MIKRIDTPFDDLPPDDEKLILDESAFFPEETEFLPDEYFTGYEPLENEVQADIITQCREFFSSGGPLKNADFGSRKAEERPQQLEMATAIAEALVNGENLCIEAPTGVGKSFAYLVPLIYRSKYCRRHLNGDHHASGTADRKRPAQTCGTHRYPIQSRPCQRQKKLSLPQAF